MSVTLVTLLTVVPPPARAPQDARKGLVVEVDPRIELMSVIFRLAGNREYNMGRVRSYADAADAHFADFRDHDAVRMARSLKRRRGVSFDAVMSYAVHLKPGSRLAPATSFDPLPKSLDKRWTPKDASAFLAAARRFAKDADFRGFFKKHGKLYATAVARMQKVLDEEAQLGWFDEFFGARPSAKFALALGMLNGPANYGPRFQPRNGREDLYCVLGVARTDRDGLPRFQRSMLSTVVHEFSHSYCNRLVDKHAKKLEAAGRKIFPKVASAMRKQAYGTWKTMMYESLVRACVVRYIAAHDGEKARKREIAMQKSRKFLWTGELSDLLAEYEKQRKKYRTLDAFMPRIIGFFNEWAEDLPAVDDAAPKVVSMTPVNGARGVDPKITEIKITFDRAMRDRCWAFVGGGPKYPETTGKPFYDAERKVITLPVKLKPDWSYEFWLNRGRFSSFQSEQGVKLESVHVRFKTKS